LEYLARFIKTVEETWILSHTAAVFVASAFVMDAYPPGMHGRYELETLLAI
jgi:hypothetical protein